MISDEAQEAKCFSVTVDSSPDISHVDELAICIRYVNNKDYAIVDRFLGFVGNAGHKAVDMFKATMDTLQEFSLNIKNCRRESHDNASNISGIYNGL